MPLNRVKAGSNMYPGWITHTHSHLGGECPHKCTYCYVDSFRHRVPKYQGKLRLVEKELLVPYGKGKTIFIEHCNDLFAEDVPLEFIVQIMDHCDKWPENTYVFQTKNPARLLALDALLPNRHILGVTVETNRDIIDIGNAPQPIERMRGLFLISEYEKPFLTIEPILDFDIERFPQFIKKINPSFVNIGADSKGHNLPEPSMEKVQALIDKLTEYGIEVKEKHNLERLKGG